MSARHSDAGNLQEQGFTLVEVLVAFVVSAIMLAMILTGSHFAAARQQAMNRQRQALSIASSEIERFRAAPFVEGEQTGSAAGLVFTPHLVPMTRGVLATIYCRGRATTAQCLDAARRFYAGRAFIRVTDKPPQTKWATGSNLAFVSYAADPERKLVIAMGVVDNLGKGASGAAVQNMDLMLSA